MRLFTPLSLPLAAAAALLLPTSTHAAAAPAPTTCTTHDTRTFPLTTRIHGGPDTYEAGGGYGTWYLDLTNTTRRTCEDIHPVIVLVDEKHTLERDQPQLEFYDGTTPRPVRLEPTDQDELVGAFGGKGVTVGPGKTLTVKVRLALTSDAVPNEITANAAVVQRHDDDGDWVGQSNDYRFTIEAEPDSPTTPDPTGPSPSPRTPTPPHREELAGTGLTAPTPTAARTLAAALLLTTGGTLLLTRRR
ncbi:hypothetical protein [Streptomyces sp. NPDC020489]|uniref:hypothetical protein n=1 Tax=Streptomyces sp. NPDC020489 TaxID=3365077 RepID=UPI00379A6988